MILGPAVSAYAAHRALTVLVGPRWIRALAGLVYGFSPFVIAHAWVGHVNLVWSVLPPVVLWASVRVLAGRGHDGGSARPWRDGALLGLAFAVQVGLYTQTVALGAVAARRRRAGAGRGGARGRRGGACPGSPGSLAAAVVVLAVLCAWPAWVLLRGPSRPRGPIRDAVTMGADAANLVVPSPLTAIRPGTDALAAGAARLPRRAGLLPGRGDARGVPRRGGAGALPARGDSPRSSPCCSGCSRSAPRSPCSAATPGPAAVAGRWWTSRWSGRPRQAGWRRSWRSGWSRCGRWRSSTSPGRGAAGWRRVGRAVVVVARPRRGGDVGARGRPAHDDGRRARPSSPPARPASARPRPTAGRRSSRRCRGPPRSGQGGGDPLRWQALAGYSFRQTGGYFIGGSPSTPVLHEGAVGAFQRGVADGGRGDAGGRAGRPGGAAASARSSSCRRR